MINYLNFSKEKFFQIILYIIFNIFFFKIFFYTFDWIIAFKSALIDKADKIFWDFEVYKCAANKLINDQNPYTLLTECMPSKKPFIHNYPILSTF